MRSWTVPAVLAALFSAAAAHACWFKCWSRPAAPPDHQAVVGQTVVAGTAYLQIVSVDGFPVDMTKDPNVQGEVNSAHDVDVVVNADYNTGLHSELIDLVLTDLGPRTAAAVARKPGDKRHHQYKWKVLIEARVGTDSVRAAGATLRYWQIHFTMPCSPAPELSAYNKYQVQAFYPSETSPTVRSDPVTFVTSR